MSEDGVGIHRLIAHLAERKSLVVVILALIVGILLMLSGTSGKSAEDAVEISYSTEELENKVAELCRHISGVGNVRVMITVDRVSQRLYAMNVQYNSDYSKTEYVTASGGLVPTGERAMTVRGVGIVCEGGDDMQIRLKLTNLVCALFDIGSDCVSVVGGG